jgi:hypothetical protein
MSDIGKQVFVYSNLHLKVWSVRHKGIVIGHADVLRLDNVTFKVSEAGRQRVLREGKKNVHAGAYGTLSGFDADLGVEGGTAVTYNPYRFRSFVTLGGHVPVHHADVTHMAYRQVAIAGHIA